MGQRRPWIPEAVEVLPHWARVAFAARCGRIVLPLFDRYWSDEEARHRERLENAIGLAEQSAAEAAPLPGLQDASTSATGTAGAALTGIHGLATSASVPTDEHAAIIASFVAKAAEWAAKCALGPADTSARSCLEAYTFARDAAHPAEESQMLERLQHDFESLYRVARRGRWSNSTPVHPSVFDLLGDEAKPRPWWRPW